MTLNAPGQLVWPKRESFKLIAGINNVRWTPAGLPAGEGVAAVLKAAKLIHPSGKPTGVYEIRVPVVLS